LTDNSFTHILKLPTNVAGMPRIYRYNAMRALETDHDREKRLLVVRLDNDR
jgi:hypothetical protein